MKYSIGPTFKSISSNDIKSAGIMVTNFAEQQKNDVFFQQVDETITFYQSKFKKRKKGICKRCFADP
ncbi:restriction endonuclease subunit S domain-containing protein [Bombilactobacillus apium]|nr:hypothetical protein [Bombilactobacillus apium]